MYVCVYMSVYMYMYVCTRIMYEYECMGVCMYVYVCMYMYVCTCMYVYKVSQEERTKLREGVPYVKLYRYNPKHLCPKLNGFRGNGK